MKLDSYYRDIIGRGKTEVGDERINEHHFKSVLEALEDYVRASRVRQALEEPHRSEFRVDIAHIAELTKETAFKRLQQEVGPPDGFQPCRFWGEDTRTLFEKFRD